MVNAGGETRGSPAKRAKVDPKAAALTGLARLNEAEKTSILQRLIKDGRLSATKVVSAVLEKRDAKPVKVQKLLKRFGSDAWHAFHQLDRLRPSQQCNQCHRVTDDINELIEEACRLKAAHAIMALARVAGVTSHAGDTGQVFHEVASEVCYALSTALEEQLQLVHAADWPSLKDAKKQMDRVQTRLDELILMTSRIL